MRLVLDSIVLHNFKSYKGTHTIKNLNKAFTAIVGPNGSGKSNVIDSILFVLGFRAKKMRHQQVTDLIYNDGARESECFVELIFNKFKIKRSVNINKTIKYFVDGEEVSSGSIIKMMMSEGVDMEHNRFLILQGEIESIAMMKPKEGLLEFLEDIIGTSGYKKVIEETQCEIKDLEQAKIDAQTSLNFIKKDFDHAESLKIQNEEAAREKADFLRSKEKICTLKRALETRRRKELEEEKKKLGLEIEELRSSNEETRKIFETYEEKYQKAKKKLNQKEGIFLEVKREYKKAERHNDLQNEVRSKAERRIKTLKQEIETITARNEVRAREKEKYAKELQENEEELACLYKALEKNKAILAGEEKKNKSKEEFRRIKEKESHLIALLDKKSEKALKRAKITAEIKIKTNEARLLEEEINQLKTKISGIQVRDKKENTMNTLSDLGELESKLKDIEKDISLTQKELLKRKSRHDEATQKKECDLKEKEVMSHLKKVKGVIGRLQDVGSIDSKYEIPLRIACSKLNNIIVDTTSTADKCMEIIKKKNIPRTTLIVLEKIREIPSLEKLPAPYLFDLVECEEPFKKCFYFALTDTLLCEDLKEAEKLAFGGRRRRVVTLDGKLIEKSGVMTGGKISERIKGYDELEKTLSRMEGIRKEYQEKINALEEEQRLDAYKKSLKKKEEEFRRVMSDLEVSMKREEGFGLEKLDEEIKKTKESVETLKKRVEESLDGAIREVQLDLKIGSEKIEILEKRNQEMKIHLAEAGPEEIKEKEEEIKNKTREIEKSQLVEVGDIKKKYEKLEEEYNSILLSFKEAQEEMNSIKKRMGDDYHNEIDLKNKYEDLEEKIGDNREKVKRIEEEWEKIGKEMEELRGIIPEEGEWMHKQGEGRHKRGEENMHKRGEGRHKLGEENMHKQEGENMHKQVDIEKTVYAKYSKDQIKDALKKEIKKIEAFESREILPGVFEEYLSIKKSYEKVREECEEATEKYKNKRNQFEDLKSKRYEEFMEGFKSVSKYLKEIYKTLTYGGNAELELVDYLDPFSEGVVLAVMPPKKCWKNVNNLSGGEKTLSSLSLIFALHKYKPSPFYVMDEIDAALDYRNVCIISSYLKEMTKNSQFIVISLRNDMFEMSRSILGVYKTNNVSKFLMVNIDELKRVALKD